MEINIATQANQKAIIGLNTNQLNVKKMTNLNYVPFRGIYDEKSQKARNIIFKHMEIAKTLDGNPKENIMFVLNNIEMVKTLADVHELKLEDKAISKFVTSKMVKQEMDQLLSRFSSWLSIIGGVVNPPNYLFTEELGQSFIEYCKKIPK